MTKRHLHQKFHIKLLMQSFTNHCSWMQSKLEPISPDSTGQDTGEPSKNQFYQASSRNQCIMGQPVSEPDDPGQEVFSDAAGNCGPFS